MNLRLARERSLAYRCGADENERWTEGKVAILRVDLNTHVDDDGILDDYRLQASLNSVLALLNSGAQVIILYHLGRPWIENVEDRTTLFAQYFMQNLGIPVAVLYSRQNCNKEQILASQKRVFLFENLRNFWGERADCTEFASRLAALADIYVNDALGVCHRLHASVHALPKLFPEPDSLYGLLIERELRNINSWLQNTSARTGVILGCGKVADKLGALSTIVGQCSDIFIYGKAAFAVQEQIDSGKDMCDFENPENKAVWQLLNLLERHNITLHLPLDHKAFLRSDLSMVPISIDSCRLPSELRGADLGPKSIAHFEMAIKPLERIFWNGPPGIFNFPDFMRGTAAIVRALSSSDANVLAGGGDTSAAIRRFGSIESFFHVSTGGGATLKLLKDKLPPALAIYA